MISRIGRFLGSAQLSLQRIAKIPPRLVERVVLLITLATPKICQQVMEVARFHRTKAQASTSIVQMGPELFGPVFDSSEKADLRATMPSFKKKMQKQRSAGVMLRMGSNVVESLGYAPPLV